MAAAPMPSAPAPIMYHHAAHPVTYPTYHTMAVSAPPPQYHAPVQGTPQMPQPQGYNAQQMSQPQGYNAQQMPQHQGYNTGARPKAPTHRYIRDNDPLQVQASAVCKRQHLQTTTIPETNTQDFSIDQQGQIWPKAGFHIAPFNPRLSIFQKNLQNGRFAYTTAIRNHMANRCVSCGLQGHQATSKNCPYHDDPGTNTLCKRCRAAFHHTCRYPDAVIQQAHPNAFGGN